MTVFIVNGEEKELRYDHNGIDISQDFIGNTDHGMDVDDEGRYIATQEDYQWWKSVIEAHERLDRTIAAYKGEFDAGLVEQVISDWADDDYESHPKQVLMGLQQAFGELE